MYRMKSKKALFVIIPVCLALVAAIVLLVFFVTGAFLSPKARVMLALSKTFGSGSIISEYSGNTSGSKYGYAPEYLSDLLIASDALEDMKERGYSVNASYTLSDLDTPDTMGYTSYGSLSNTGMKVSGDIDTINRVAYYDLTLQYNFIRISLGKYYINDTAISMAMPSHFDGYLTLPTDTFGTSYNASIFPSLLAPIPQELESEVSFSAFDLICPLAADKDSFFTDEDTLSVLKDFYDDIEVDKTGETRSILIGTKQQDCDEYVITLEKEDILSLIEAYEDWYFSSNRERIDRYDVFYAYFTAQNSSSANYPSSYSDLLEELFDAYKRLMAVDHEIYVYLDNKDRLAAASYEIELDTGSIVNSNFYDTTETLIDENIDFDDIYDGFIEYMIYGNLPNINDPNNFTTEDPADDLDATDTCRISAEIIFHGRDYLPERYEGSFLIDFENGYSCEARYTGENRTDTRDMLHSVLNAAIDLEIDGASECYDIAYESSYQTEDKDLAAELTITDENHTELLNIVSDSTLTLEDDTIEFELEEMTFTVNSDSGEVKATLEAEVAFSPLTDRVPLPEGKERNMLTMSKQDYEQLWLEIVNSFSFL